MAAFNPSKTRGACLFIIIRDIIVRPAPRHTTLAQLGRTLPRVSPRIAYACAAAVPAVPAAAAATTIAASARAAASASTD